MVNLFHQGGTTSLAPASSLDRLGSKGLSRPLAPPGILCRVYLAVCVCVCVCVCVYTRA